MIFNMVGGGSNGGGGAGLNFSVICSMQEPQNPSENTIWVQTDTTITNVSFADSVADIEEGALTFFYKSVDKTQVLSGNAVFKMYDDVLNGKSCQIWGELLKANYSDGTQTKFVDAFIRKETEWVRFSTSRYSFYNNGVYDVEFNKGFNYTDFTDHVTIGKTNGGNGILVTKLPINIANITTLYVTYAASNAGTATKFGLSNQNTVASADVTRFDIAGVALTATGGSSTKRTVSLDVSSLTGTGYVKIAVSNSGYGNGVISIFEIWGE